MRELLFTVTWQNAVVAEIDAEGNYVCHDKNGMIAALREQAQFWQSVSELAQEMRRELASRESPQETREDGA